MNRDWANQVLKVRQLILADLNLTKCLLLKGITVPAHSSTSLRKKSLLLVLSPLLRLRFALRSTCLKSKATDPQWKHTPFLYKETYTFLI